MFNGIIFNTGKVKLIKKKNKSITLVVKTNLSLNKKDLGSSICCNGVCLTLTKISGKLIYYDIEISYSFDFLMKLLKDQILKILRKIN